MLHRRLSTPLVSVKPLAIRISVLLSVLVVVSRSITIVAAAGAIYCVAPTSVATSAPCANSPAYTDIQSAVDAASTGDEIRVAAGTYTAPNASYVITILYKAFTIRGGYTPSDWTNATATDKTIIDGENARPGVLVFQASEVTFERVTITHGRDTGSGGGAINANLFPSSGRGVNLVDVSITNNSTTGSGGGLFVTGGLTSLIRTQISNNTAGEDGGGFYGLRLNANASTIAQNTANRNAGGVDVLYASFDNSRLIGNTASTGDGGGIHFNPSQIGGTLAMTQTQVIGNSAGNRGGGIYLGALAEAQMSWSLLGNNDATQGDALVVDPRSQAPSQVYLQNMTIARNAVSPRAAIQVGVLNPSEPATLTLSNTVVTSHTVAIARQSTTTLNGDYNAFFGNGTNQTVDGAATPLPFVHLLSTEPQFTNPVSNDFHLRASSPLRDAASPGLNYTGQHDLDGIAVPVGSAVDIGAYEYILREQYRYLPLALR